jgi:hypothetical protein
MPPLQIISHHARRTFQSVSDLTLREKQRLLAEMQQTRGLVPILMKPRNGQRWTPEERMELRGHLGRLSRLSPYLVLVVMPGGFFILPVFAWWLDRRRTRVRAPAPPLS